MSNLNVVDKQTGDVGGKLMIVEVGFVVSVHVSLIALICAR